MILGHPLYGQGDVAVQLGQPVQKQIERHAINAFTGVQAADLGLVGIERLRGLGLRQASLLDDLSDFMGEPALGEQLVSIVKPEIGKHIATAFGDGLIDVAHGSISLCCLPGPDEGAV